MVTYRLLNKWSVVPFVSHNRNSWNINITSLVWTYRILLTVTLSCPRPCYLFLFRLTPSVMAPSDVSHRSLPESLFHWNFGIRLSPLSKSMYCFVPLKYVSLVMYSFRTPSFVELQKGLVSLPLKPISSYSLSCLIYGPPSQNGKKVVVVFRVTS